MEHVRDQVLDNYCEAIAQDRETMAQAKSDEQGSIQGALARMKAKKYPSYQHARVELSFVAGADKLRVRLTKDHTDAGVPSDAGEASGDGAGLDVDTADDVEQAGE